MASFRPLAPRTDGRPASGFDFTLHMRALCEDMVRRLPELRHIDLNRVAVSFCQTRKAVQHGRYASLTPLRFAGGQTQTMRRGRMWQLQRVIGPSGQEMLYILNFYLPRFLNLDFRGKLTTVVHELWHIGPRCDGDVRRYQGRCYAHSASRKEYDRLVEALTEGWLRRGPPPALYEFLHHDFRAVAARYGAIYGVKIPVPKLIPLD